MKYQRFKPLGCKDIEIKKFRLHLTFLKTSIFSQNFGTLRSMCLMYNKDVEWSILFCLNLFWAFNFNFFFNFNKIREKSEINLKTQKRIFYEFISYFYSYPAANIKIWGKPWNKFKTLFSLKILGYETISLNYYYFKCCFNSAINLSHR